MREMAGSYTYTTIDELIERNLKPALAGEDIDFDRLVERLWDIGYIEYFEGAFHVTEPEGVDSDFWDTVEWVQSEMAYKRAMQ